MLVSEKTQREGDVMRDPRCARPWWTRRDFLKGSAAAVAGVYGLSPGLVLAEQVLDKFIGGAPDFCRLRCERRLGAVMARFIGATTDQGATHDRQGAPHQALGAITRAAPLFSTRLRWLCPATTRSFTRGPLASSLVMSASYQTDQNRRWQGPSHLPSSKRGDALSLRRCSWMPSNPCRPCPPYRRPAAFRRPPWVPACRPPCPRW